MSSRQLQIHEQLCFYAQQEAHKKLKRLNSEEKREARELRHLDSDEALQDAFMRELYFLDVAELRMWPRARLIREGRKYGLTKPTAEDIARVWAMEKNVAK